MMRRTSVAWVACGTAAAAGVPWQPCCREATSVLTVVDLNVDGSAACLMPVRGRIQTKVAWLCRRSAVFNDPAGMNLHVVCANPLIDPHLAGSIHCGHGCGPSPDPKCMTFPPFLLRNTSADYRHR